MNKVRLGRSDLMVTSICLGPRGSATCAIAPATASTRRARVTMHAIFDRPVHFIDTSRIYGVGRARGGDLARPRSAADQGFFAGFVDTVDDLFGVAVGRALGVVFADRFQGGTLRIG